MKIITIEDQVYLAPDKMVKILQEKQKELQSNDTRKNYKVYNELELNLSDFINLNKTNWRCLGYVHFDFRL